MKYEKCNIKFKKKNQKENQKINILFCINLHSKHSKTTLG